MAFAAPWAAVAASVPASGVSEEGQRTVIVRRVTRRVIISPAQPSGVRYVVAGGSGGSTTASAGSSGSSGGAPAPTTTSGS